MAGPSSLPGLCLRGTQSPVRLEVGGPCIPVKPEYLLNPSFEISYPCSCGFCCNVDSLATSSMPWTKACPLGACPRIESLLRKSHFGSFLRSFSLNMSNYAQSTRYAHGAGSAQSTRYAHRAGSAQSAPQTTCHGAGSSPQMTSKWLSLATTSILGQAPSLRAGRQAVTCAG